MNEKKDNIQMYSRPNNTQQHILLNTKYHMIIPSDKTTAVVPTTPAPTRALLVELLPSLTDAKKNGDDISSSSSFLVVALSFVDILEVEDIIDRLGCMNVKARTWVYKHKTKDSGVINIIINL